MQIPCQASDPQNSQYFQKLLLQLLLDGEGSQACPHFKQAEKCGNCKNFVNPDKYGMGRYQPLA